MPAASTDPPAPPDLTTTHLGTLLTLTSPILAASGTFGYGEELKDLADCRSLGALITPTLTLRPRQGNPMPRTAEASAGLLHAIGLPNPGLDAFVSAHLPCLRALPCPSIASIAGETPAEWTALASTLSGAGGLAALELNLSPLELQIAERARQSLPDETTLLANLSEAIAAVRAATRLPLIAKLPPVGVEIGVAAQAAARSGADLVAVSQAFPGVAVELNRRRFRFAGVTGGLSGPCIKPMALYQVWRAAQAVCIPVLGAGGIMTMEDVLEFVLAGASLVAIGTANLIHPSAIARMSADLSAYLSAQGLADIRSLIGAAQEGKRSGQPFGA